MKKRLLTLFLSLFVCFAAGQTNDLLDFAKESQHFKFYSSRGDLPVLDTLAITLENNYYRITNRLGIQIDKKIDVKVFPDIKTFHIAINSPDAPDWFVGAWNGQALVMVSPLNPGSVHTYESLMQVVVHEFVHIAVYYARGDKGLTGLPKWLSEGYAQYEAGQINDRIRRYVESSLADKAPPSWTMLNNASDIEFGSINGYALSITIVEFLVVTYGMDKLVMLIKEPDNIESIYGQPETALEKQWIRYLKHETAE